MQVPEGGKDSRLVVEDVDGGEARQSVGRRRRPSQATRCGDITSRTRASEQGTNHASVGKMIGTEYPGQQVVRGLAEGSQRKCRRAVATEVGPWWDAETYTVR